MNWAPKNMMQPYLNKDLFKNAQNIGFGLTFYALSNELQKYRGQKKIGNSVGWWFCGLSLNGTDHYTSNGLFLMRIRHQYLILKILHEDGDTKFREHLMCSK